MGREKRKNISTDTPLNHDKKNLPIKLSERKGLGGALWTEFSVLYEDGLKEQVVDIRPDSLLHECLLNLNILLLSK